MNNDLADALFFEAGGVVPVAPLSPSEIAELREDLLFGDDTAVLSDGGVLDGGAAGAADTAAVDANSLGSVDVFGDGFWWPSDAVQDVWVDGESGISRSSAALITAEARANVMGWIGGVGLHPVEVYDRFANGCLLHGCGDVLVPDGVKDLIMRNRDARWRGLMNAIFGEMKAVDRRSLENDIYGVLLSASADGKIVSRSVSESGTWFDVLERGSVNVEPGDDVAGFGVFDQVSGVDVEVFRGCSRELVDWAAGALLEFLAGSGTDPFRVVQRFYGLCFYRYKSIVGEMNGRDLAGIMSQGRAQFAAMEKRVFTDPIEWVTGVVEKVKGQKGAAACGADGVYAANARRNKPRQMLNGQAGVSGVDMDLDRAMKSGKAQRRLSELRAAAELREAESLDREWREMFQRKSKDEIEKTENE